MRGWLAVFVLLASCSRTSATDKRELFRTTADGVEIIVRAELHGWHTPAHAGTEFKWVAARDDFAIYLSTTAKRGAKDLGVYDTSGDTVRTLDTPVSRDAGDSELASLSVEACPIPHGIAFHPKDEWVAVFALGDRVIQTKLDSHAADCPTLGPVTAESVLAASPGGATSCLALDEAGLRPAAIDCFVRGTSMDLSQMRALPKEGAASREGGRVVHDHRDALVARFAADPSAIDAMIDKLATKPPPYEEVGIARERLLAIDAAHALPRFIDRVTTECATSCSEDVVKLGELAIGWKGTAFVTPDACAKGIAFARSLASKGDADAMKRAFLVLRGFYGCLDASARPLLVSGLATATTSDTKDDANCQPFTGSSGPEVSALCESFPRFAGTWLASHCGPDAIAAATKIARAHPRTPFEPREDQLLDGALRVLGSCDKTAFEAAIAHVPDTKDLRATFLKK